MKNKHLRSIAFVMAMAMTLAGCGVSGTGTSDSAGTNSAGGGTNNSSGAQATREKTLIWAVPTTPNGMDHEYHYSAEAHEAEKNVYDSLLSFETIYDEETGFLVPDFGKTVPALAESVDLSEDSCTITVKLREGVMSHAGNELTTADVLYKWERAESLGANIWNFCGMFSGITDLSQIKIIDDYTFSVTTPEPNPLATVFLAHLGQQMLDSEEIKKHAVDGDEWATEWMSQYEAGYGPYTITSFVPGDQVVFEKFANYWDKENEPYYEKVIMKEIPESANRVSMLISGDIDAATTLSASELKQLESQEGIKVMHYPGNSAVHVGFSCQSEPYNNPKVRQALNYAFPYKDVIDTVYLGYASQATSIVPTIYPDHTSEYWNFDTDLKAAKELLTEAGYPDGFTTSVFIENTSPAIEQIAIMMKSNFAQIGVNVEIQKLSSGDYNNRIFAHNFDGMYIQQDSAGTPDGGFALGLYCNGVQNVGDWKNDEFNKLYDKMMTTTDVAVRSECADRMQEICVKEDPIWILICEPGYNIAIRDDIENVKWEPLNSIDWNYLTPAN